MKPLADLTVIAVEQYGAGPFGSLQLAQLGADVIKVENLREGGDSGRRVRHRSEAEVDGDSLFFQTFNLGKRSIAIDLASDEGRAILHKLVRCADAVYNNLRGNTQDKLGITYAKLREVNPRIVCVHLTAYGRRGSRKSWPGYDYLVQSEAGYLSVTGEPNSPPTRMGLSIVDQASGVQAALALVSGVMSARRTGVGADLDVSLYATGLAHLTYLGTWYLNTGHVQGREPRSSHPNLTPSQLQRTADGWLFVMVNKEKFWPLLVEALGRPAALADDAFATFAGRLTHRARLTRLLDEIFMQQPTAYWVERLTGTIPVAPVLDVGGALDNPYAQEAGRIGAVERDGAPIRVLAPAIEIDGAPLPQRAAPRPGEHADAILANLGYAPKAIARLRAQGVVE